MQSRPGVSATIIGARTREQLDQNLKAADLTLSREQIVALERVSEPTLQFPATYLRTISNSVMHAGLTVDGESSQVPAHWKAAGAKRY